MRNKVRRIRFWWNLGGAYFQRYKYWFLAIFGAAIVFIFTVYKITPVIWRPNTITIGYVGTYSLKIIPADILSLATGSLIVQDTSGKPVGQLASSWTISADGKTYVVFLKDNLRWHDGTNVEAKDISIAIGNVKITALNKRAIEFRLPNPIASFPLALNKPVFKAGSFYGTGEYRIVDIERVDETVKKIVLVTTGRNLPKVEIKFYQTEEQILNALKIGDVKSAILAQLSDLDKWPNLTVEKKPNMTQIVTIFFNNQDVLLSSKELRQALIYAINRSDFDGVVTFSPISQSSWAYNPNIKRYDYNTGKVRELLAKANLPNIKITLSLTADLEDVGKQIQRDWQAAGIDVVLVVEKKVPSDFQALLAVESLPPDPDQYALWHSTQKVTNITKYKNVKIDKLLEDARNEQNENERMSLYFEFQKFLVEDAPAGFLYHPYQYQVTYKNARDLLAKIH